VAWADAEYGILKFEKNVFAPMIGRATHAVEASRLTTQQMIFDERIDRIRFFNFLPNA
jgi:hypothetical protein